MLTAAALTLGGSLLASVPTATAVPAATPAPAGTTTVQTVACPRHFVCIYPKRNFGGNPYPWREDRGSTKHLPDSIRSRGSSVINNTGKAAQVWQKDNYHGRRVCVGADGGSIQDLRSYGLNKQTHSLRFKNRCGS